MTFTVTENQFHEILGKWLDAALPKNSIWHHSPNEGKRHVSYKMRLKKLGMRSGWPDIEVFVHRDHWWSGISAPIFLEVKAPKRGTLSANQKQIQAKLLDLNCAVATVNKLSAAKVFLSALIELQENTDTKLYEQIAERMGAL